jgi:hypothetical protein
MPQRGQRVVLVHPVVTDAAARAAVAVGIRLAALAARALVGRYAHAPARVAHVIYDWLQLAVSVIHFPSGAYVLAIPLADGQSSGFCASHAAIATCGFCRAR